ncbi:unnamed protein product [Paramecium octaurelia]|uniref:WD40-repeat-containing domain n=1 Tax=Paramecium octaurelia TaxID=43137 RepID=A0A8S1S8A8_PAROT|nr:unnamed protein product [Paramecium octaurelia]
MTQFSQKEFKLQEIQSINIYQQCIIGISALYFDQKGEYIYGLGEHHKLKIYDLRTRCSKLFIFCRCECNLGIQVCEDISTIVTCWEPGVLIIYRVETRNWKILRIQYIISSIHFTRLSNVNQQLNHFACSKSDGSLTVYHNSKGLFQQFQQICDANQNEWLNIILFESFLICSNQSVQIQMFKFNQNLKRYEFFKIFTNNITIYSIFGSFDRILILGSNKKYKQYEVDLEKGDLKCLGETQDQGSFLSQILFLDGGNSFIEIGFSKYLNLWKFDKKEIKISETIEFEQRISTASVSKNKNAVIIGFKDGTIKLYA